MPGFYDLEGVWIHAESDAFTATSTVLNKGQQSVSDALKVMRPAVDAARSRAEDAAGSAEASAEEAIRHTTPLIAPLDDAMAAVMLIRTSDTREALTAAIAEHTSDTDWVGTAFTPAADWSTEFQYIRRRGPWVDAQMKVIYNGPPIVVPADGNINNSIVGTFEAGYRPRYVAAIGTAGLGRAASFGVAGDGILYLSSCTPGVDIPTGYAWTIQGAWLTPAQANDLGLSTLAPRGREVVTVTTSSLEPGATWTGTIPLGLSFRLLKISTSRPARVRLYTTGPNRTADADRAAGTDPAGDHGVILEYVTTAEVLTAGLAPVVDGSNMAAPPVVNTPAAITNTDSIAGTVTLTFTRIETEY